MDKNNKILSLELNDAVKYGSDAALILYHIRYLLDYSRREGLFKKNGLFWCCASAETLAETFPHLNGQKIKRILQRLEKDAVIFRQEMDKNKWNKTKFIAMREYSYDETTGEKSPIYCRSCGEFKAVDNSGKSAEIPVKQHESNLTHREIKNDHSLNDHIKKNKNKKSDSFETVDNLPPQPELTPQNLPNRSERTKTHPFKKPDKNKPPIVQYKKPPVVVNKNYQPPANQNECLNRLKSLVGKKANLSDSKEEEP